jgi:phage terminase large subunit-like protein
MNRPGPVPLEAYLEAVDTLDAEFARRAAYKFKAYFPDCTEACTPDSPNVEDHVVRPGMKTPVCRVLYVKHLRFFAAGGLLNDDGTMMFRQRLIMAGNRIGKTEAGAYEVTCHLTGRYPHWWSGRRFDEAGAWWCAGDTGETTRNILQTALWGPPEAPRTGMLPAHLIHHSSGSENQGLDTVWIEHVTGKLASLAFKSFDQGRRSFQGTAKQGVWLDEEAPSAIRAECLLRLMTTDGVLLQTFTPLNGLTPGIVEFLEDAVLDTGEGLIGAKAGVFGDTESAA